MLPSRDGGRRVPTAAKRPEGGDRRPRVRRVELRQLVACPEQQPVFLQHLDQAGGAALVGVLGRVTGPSARELDLVQVALGTIAARLRVGDLVNAFAG